MPYSILLVDDEENILKSLSRVLGTKNYTITTCKNPSNALDLVKSEQFQLVISDQRMPEMLGTELMQEINKWQQQTRRILMSGYADFSDVINSFNSESIHQFISKPCDSDILRKVVNTQLSIYEEAKLQQKGGKTNSSPSLKSIARLQKFHDIVSSDPVILQQIAFIKKVANFGAPFFIQGETGTGKELFAKAIHLESPRKEQIFLALNCANLTENLLESQLFGHVKGAFTGADTNQQGMIAAAEKGTLFLDEVTELPLTLQAKLLRVLQEKEFTPLGKTEPVKFDVQIISASSLDLSQAVEKGVFREDLRFRLEVMPISIPPLRERKRDIKALFVYLLEQQLVSLNISMPTINPQVHKLILAYPWPGNVRELVNTCMYIAAMVSNDKENINVENLPKKIVNPKIPKLTFSSNNAQKIELTKGSLQEVLNTLSGNKTATAAYFDVSRMTLWRRMKKFNLL